MKICSMFSGGKDSTYALHWAIFKGFNVECLITIIPMKEDSWMFQYPNVEFTIYQAKVLGIPIISQKSTGEKGEEINDLRKAFVKAKEEKNIDGIVTGAILSDYQRLNINLIAEELGLKVYSPLWRKDQENYLREIVTEGFRFLIISTSAYGFPANLVGKEINEEDTEKIIRAAKKYGFNPALEGGEAETFVVNAPLFKRKLNVEGKVIRKGEFNWFFKITRIL
ncbi:ATP-binding protein [Candidatus Acidianus copahuensis]|uniref:ATP-binding protein n=1 Tax=Candidatus Acidianus copahuensis TaxID=1160895 RepID=A0A031LMU5_9CREN|nr:diphthine--ammonia ligase [Candidatus Acidianus copahuensis]EZQ03215.1 ATP-binding protein [Candidatus Acidianus copahuensis]